MTTWSIPSKLMDQDARIVVQEQRIARLRAAYLAVEDELSHIEATADALELGKMRDFAQMREHIRADYRAMYDMEPGDLDDEDEVTT